MSSLHLTDTSSSINPVVDEHQWVIQMCNILDDQLNDDGDDIGIPICIFNVPKALKFTNPELYTPQVVALGPYHSWRPELREMESYKLSSAKKTQKQLRNIIKFHILVEQIKILDPRIRCSYHKYLDIKSETLAWMMAIDSCFLLEFLQIYHDAKEAKPLVPMEARMSSCLTDYVRKRPTHNAILRDIVMLENQIPLFVLRKMLEFQLQSLQLADEKLLSMLMGLCQDVFPFEMAVDFPMLEVSCCAHLLDFLHQAVVPNIQESLDAIEEFRDHEHVQEKAHERLFSRLTGAVIRCMKKLVLSRPARSVFKLPWVVISNLPVFIILKQPVEHLFFSRFNNEGQNHENESPRSRSHKNPPLLEEITIPSVVELSSSGIQFFPSDGDIRSIKFDSATNKFYLPAIKLDVNSEVILRNLVAYEASNAQGPMIFTRYTELMNGIIDTAEDAKLLRKRGIILNHLKSDEEVANLWNGMSKSLRLTRVQFLDQVIEHVNKYYEGKWKVKVERFIKTHVFKSWQFATILAAVFFLFLMTLQVSSTVFNSACTSRVRGGGCV